MVLSCLSSTMCNFGSSISKRTQVQKKATSMILRYKWPLMEEQETTVLQQKSYWQAEDMTGVCRISSGMENMSRAWLFTAPHHRRTEGFHCNDWFNTNRRSYFTHNPVKMEKLCAHYAMLKVKVNMGLKKAKKNSWQKKKYQVSRLSWRSSAVGVALKGHRVE